VPEVHVRFVSKGVNPIQITNSLIDIQQTVNHPEVRNRAQWFIEVVTDNFMELGHENRVVNQIVVPSDYVTPRNTLFKARALHYAAVSVGTDLDAWVLHMDEESYFDSENAKHIIAFCDNENYLIRFKRQKPSFANGYIT
jgi:egghead protein (zeste-white 4 protein)